MKALTQKYRESDPAPQRALEAERHRLQQKVDAHFEEKAAYWDELYHCDTVFGTIHQKRLATVLKAVDELNLPAESPILEIGCGAGLLAAALAQRSHLVEAIDSAEAMVRLTRQRADSANVGDRIFARGGDVHDLDSPDNCFSLVLAIGVLPWLTSPHAALKEMVRVVQRNGYLIFTLDNVWRLNHMLDPLQSPLGEPLRRVARRTFDALALGRAKRRIRTAFLPRQASMTEAPPISAHFYSLREVRGIIAAAGLEQVHLVSIGFGPFSFLGREILPNVLGVKVHRALQSLADRKWPWFRTAGGQFLIVARKR